MGYRFGQEQLQFKTPRRQPRLLFVVQVFRGWLVGWREQRERFFRRLVGGARISGDVDAREQRAVKQGLFAKLLELGVFLGRLFSRLLLIDPLIDLVERMLDIGLQIGQGRFVLQTRESGTTVTSVEPIFSG